jgi:AraC-like DNA-binding protein
MLKTIEEETLRRDMHYNECIDLKIKHLLINISRNIHNIETDPPISSEIVESLRCLRAEMLNNIKDNWIIEDMARYTNLSPSYLQFAYKQIFHISPKKDLILKRIEHAKIYLKQTYLSIDKISDILGYSNQFHFIRQFKKYANMTPLKYRNCK